MFGFNMPGACTVIPLAPGMCARWPTEMGPCLWTQHAAGARVFPCSHKNVFSACVGDSIFLNKRSVGSWESLGINI